MHEMVGLQRVKTNSGVLNPEFLVLLKKFTGIDVFIETGTFLGETTALASKIFSTVHSIELSEDLYNKAKKKFNTNNKISIHQGESGDVLNNVLPGINKPIIFWLDAHYSEVQTAKGKKNTPIIEELLAIKNSGVKESIILIDDLRCFVDDKYVKRESLTGYPTVNILREKMNSLFPEASFVVIGDVLLITIGRNYLEFGDVAKACTISRAFERGNIDEVLQAEEVISNSSGSDRDVIVNLPNEVKESEKFGLGMHYRLWRGLVYAKEGVYEKAREDFERTLQLGYNHFRIYWYLAKVAKNMGDSTASRNFARVALDKCPGFEPARELVGVDSAVGISVSRGMIASSSGERTVINRCISKGNTVFDIGANVGDWTKLAISHASDLNIHLFEASPPTYQELLENTKGLSNVRLSVNNIGLGSCEKKAIFYHYADSPAWSTFHRRIEAEKKYGKSAPSSIDIKVETLDSYCEKNGVESIDFVKIDVEGGEYDVIQGATNLLKKGKINYLQFEYGGTFKDANVTLQLVFSLLKRFGYEMFKINESGLVYCSEFRKELEDFSYSNYLAVNHRLFSSFYGNRTGMLDIKTLFSKYGIRARGVLHVGAHEGKEMKVYDDLGVENVVFVEANPKVFKVLENNLKNKKNVRLFNCAISDQKGEVTLHVTSMDQSSSILPLSKHKNIYPGIVETNKIVVPATTIDALFSDNSLPEKDFNIINIDIQGAELLALRGGTGVLKNIDAINTEVNYDELYAGCAVISQLDEFLESEGFTRVHTTTPFHPSWGDALYIRKSIVRMSTLGVNGRFGNQLFQYAFLRIYAKNHGCKVETPDWIGRHIYDLDDAYISDKSCTKVAQTTQDLLECSIANSETVYRNVDFWGYFQYNTKFYAGEKSFFQSLFKPKEKIGNEIDGQLSVMRDGGRTVVGIHVRRGDYGYKFFFLTPAEWYKRWLDEMWPKLENPVLYVASDDLDSVLLEFSEYNPISSKDMPIGGMVSDEFVDFHVLGKCDHVAISNSSYSFLACMLNNDAKSFVRPDLRAGGMIEFDPWDSEPLLRNATAEEYGLPFMSKKRAAEVDLTNNLFSPSQDVKNSVNMSSIREENEVSICILSFNRREWLLESINSAIAQTLSPREIIVIDNASTDGSVDLLKNISKEYKGKLRVVFNDDKISEGDLLSRVVSEVRGVAVSFMNAGDVCHPNKIENEYSVMKSESSGIVYSNYSILDETGKEVVWAGESDSIYVGKIYPYLLGRMFPKRKIYRNELVSLESLRKVGFFDKKLFSSSLVDMGIRLSSIFNVSFCDAVLSCHRINSVESSVDIEKLSTCGYIFVKNQDLISGLSENDRNVVYMSYAEFISGCLNNKFGDI
ncbi:MAG: FkbM family methyltransferase [Gammaproteobacteria bacterium]|nr:FkbM family methyltransferase [Gammaproteobacteria bacterium]